jgi:eukaryotic-like serine/threonine-protein kinase
MLELGYPDVRYAGSEMKVLELIAEGGFGRVEKVRLTGGELVARKTFRVRADIAAIADVAKLRKRFAREVRIQSTLPTDQFIPVLGHGLDDDPPWFLMPVAEKNFEAAIVEAKEAQEIPKEALAQILESLEHLQTLQMTHRDLKPSNVLFHDGRWKLCDFGFAAVPPGQTTKLTTTLTPFGTATYCAPEQLLQFGNVTPAADIYSFGCVLHDIFDGGMRLPFQRHTCAGPLGMVVEVCTNTDPNKRFKSVAGLRSALFGVLSAPPTANVDPEAKAIVVNLASPALLSAGDLTQIRHFVRGEREFDELWAVLTALDEEALSVIHGKDVDLWNEIADLYCKWTRGHHFDFAYCDVIIGRLERIFELGSISQKAAAALSAAEVGASHNRWFVMHRLHAMCGAQLDPIVAQRIAIEIRAEEAEQNFRLCAIAVDREPSDVYHLKIAAELAEPDQE